MSNNYIDKTCKECEYHNPEAEPMFCDLTSEPNATPLRCSILKRFVKKYKFMEKIQ